MASPRLSPATIRPLSRWLRVLAACLVAIVTSSSTLAWAMPCCIHDEPTSAEATEAPKDSCCPGSASKEAPADETPDEHDDEDAPCSCPVQCAPCCGGMPAPALVPLATLQQSSFAAWTTLELRYEERSPPDGGAHDVIHVPKR